jgi:anhydro-N-acetylmuramic acid kinase
MAEYFIGTLSGTSADGIDIVLVDFAGGRPEIVSARSAPIPSPIRHEIRELSLPTHNEIERLGRLDVRLGRLIAWSINDLLNESGVSSSQVIAIGSHGQTLRHRPEADPPFTVQVGDPNTVAALTGITTVADFRRRDMALGGQGAPLAPFFHHAFFRQPGTDRAILNIGGIANLTSLPSDPSVAICGFDTGPGNCLMDEWIQETFGSEYDEHGSWAARGTAVRSLVSSLMEDAYFDLPTPKSTGREHFNLAWLRGRADIAELAPEDVQASLLQLTVSTIAHAIEIHIPECREVLVCGGGAYNRHLMQGLSRCIKNRQLQSTATYGIPPEWVEGCAFAYLARARLQGDILLLSEVTGAKYDGSIGAVFAGDHRARH